MSSASTTTPTKATAESPGRRFRSLKVAALLVAALALVLALRAFDTYTDVAEYRRYWQQPRGEPGGLRYVALGDSLAQGVGASSPTSSYVGLLTNEMAEATGQPIETMNISKSGATIEEVISEQLPRLEGLKADVLTVSVGGNDVLDYNAESWVRSVEVLCSALEGRPAVVADVPYFMHGQNKVEASQARSVLRRSCEARGVAMAPSAKPFEEAGWAGMFTLYAGDWFHYNDDGYELMAQAHLAALRPVLSQPDHR